MKHLPRLLILLAVSALMLAAEPAWIGRALAQDGKDAKAPAVETKDAAPTDAKDAKAPADAKDAKDAPAKTDDKVKTPAAQPQPEPEPAPAEASNFKVAPPADSVSAKLGSLTDAALEVEISKWGAGIESIRTARYRESLNSTEAYTVISALRITDDKGNPQVWERPFTAVAVVINGERVDLWNQAWEVVQTPASEKSVRYRITIVDVTGKPALEITRTYTLGAGDSGYDLCCRTAFRNLSDKPLSLVWEQNALGDVEEEEGPQGSDVRMVTAGYYNLDHDPTKVRVYTDDAKFARGSLINDFAETGQTIWPLADVDSDTENKNELLWVAMSNRYFTAALHRPIPEAGEGEGRPVGAPLDGVFERKLGMRVTGQMIGKHDHRLLMFTLTSKPIVLDPGAAKDLDLCLYAGPRLKKVLGNPPFSTLELGAHLVRYEQGCTFCLFDWLADFLLWFLTIIHAVVFDWGFAIIVLVLVVRLLLHPITKKAQINMTKMSKQMAKLQPELAKLKEKYKNDQARQQQEMMKLYREAGVNPMGFLGCLPMFLQMPIWVALYAMLYGAIELRHEPAFWGVFQLFGNWQFLADLSAPDNFIKFGDGGFDLPICGLHITNSLNILPILMAAVFYLQQKMTTPPPTNEQMAQQQKMMKWMVLLFPVMFYAAPSGLTLYIMASSLAGIVDSYFVRKHIKAEEEAGTLFAKKPPKPGGFFDRMQKMIEAKQKEIMEKQAEMKKRPGKRKR